MNRMILSGLAVGLVVSLAWSSAGLSQEVKAYDTASIGDFHVGGVITSDNDWQEKWFTPRQNVPNFETADTLRPGDMATLLTFFSGAAQKDGTTLLKCDVEVITPTGETQTFQTDECAPTKLSGPPTDVYLTRLNIDLGATPEDPPGKLTFRIVITDVNSGQHLELELSTLIETGETRL